MEYSDFICEMARLFNGLCGVPISVYREQELFRDFSAITLPPPETSPARRHFEKLFEKGEPVTYEIADDKLFFGLVRAQEGYSFLIGPACLSQLSDNDFRSIAFYYDVPEEQRKVFHDYLYYAPVIPFHYVIGMLSFLYLSVNRELITIHSLTLENAERGEQLMQSAFREMFHFSELMQYDEVERHTTLSFEQKMLECIRAGSPDMLKELMATTPVGRPGKVAPNSLRQAKNTAIVAITLSTRAAIAGGLSPEIAFQLSDIAIQKVEACMTINEADLIVYRFTVNFAERVSALRKPTYTNPIVDRAAHYIDEHICAKISIDDIADYCKANRSYLSGKFKSETGMTIGEYINQKKIEEAKRLLRFSDKSLSAISNYLSFSSQSHFQNVFKKVTGTTPTLYQKQYKIES